MERVVLGWQLRFRILVTHLYWPLSTEKNTTWYSIHRPPKRRPEAC